MSTFHMRQRRGDTSRSGRHIALDAFAPPDAKERICCDGLCAQGRSCPRQPRPDTPLTWADFRLAAFIVAVILGFVFLGPMTQNFVKGML